MKDPIKLSGAENVAGYCFYNERVIFHSGQNRDESDVEASNEEYNARLAITEVR